MKPLFEPEKTGKRGRPFKAVPMTTTPPENNRYYTIEEAVRLLGLHRHTLQARMREGAIKGKLIGSTWRIYRDELFDNSEYVYFFDCMDADFGDKYLTSSEINELSSGKREPLPEGQIIELARNLEATLYRYQKNDQTRGVCIYDCEA